VSIPQVNHGDTVWWHADIVHAVEVEHNGAHETSVAYIAAIPTTDPNNIKEQLRDILDGRPPVGFRRGTIEINFQGYLDERAILRGEEGRRALGYHLLSA
jgi:hypothetical protein